MVEEHLIREFIAEAEEHLLALEPNLLRLEKEPQNLELINEIFLATHSIKGTASYVGLSHISTFTHFLESLLDRLRKRSIDVSPELIDSLLEGLDALKLLVNHVALGKPAPDTSVTTQRLAQWQEMKNEENGASEQKREASPERSDAAIQSSSLSRFDIHALSLEREDCEIFADIAAQQLEFMRLSLEKIRQLSPTDDTSNQEQVTSLLTTLAKAFRKIQSSAAMLDADALDAIFEEHEQFFSSVETPKYSLNEQDLVHLPEIIETLEGIITSISAYSQEESDPPSPSQQPNISTPISPASELSYGRYMLRVDAERVDNLLNLVGELVINRARLEQIGLEIKSLYEDLRTGEMSLTNSSPFQRKKTTRIFKKLKEHFDGITLDLGRLTNQMQEATMRIRMVPISQVVSQFPRMVRDLSRQAGKEVAIVIYGADTELDKTVVDVIGDPLIHIIRNAIDHGIESPEERSQKGKSPQGTITLSAYHEGNQVVIEVSDDGKGIDIPLVKQKALQQNLISPQEADALQEHDLSYLVFHSGLSTVESVSSLSGRGVGLNVVKRYLEQINGAIELESTSGKGCNFTIKLPLTLAIIPALMVRVRTEIFAIPLISVEEAIRITSQDVRTIESHKVVHLREKMIPLIDLADLLGASVFKSQRVYDGTLSREITANASDYEPDKLYGVIISDGLREIGLIVDALLGENDIVIKSLNDELVNVEGISGASIRGDGQVSLVIDAVSLIELAIKHLRSHHRARSQKKFAFDTGHDDALSRSENFKGYSQTSVSEESETI